MKIGIVTFWESQDNYGQLLQCWALQQQLKRMGHEPFLIRYSPLKQIARHKWIKLWKVILIYPIFRKLKRIHEKKIITTIAEKNIQRKFNDFREQHITISEREYQGLLDIQKNPPTADCYICGSDQVWSKLLDNQENQIYYLHFGKENIKRIAYAASFGRDTYPPELRNILHNELARFDAVSVREKSGIDICADVGIKAVNVLDPTLLLSKEDYSRIMETPEISGKYFYTYSINVTSPTKDLCWEHLAKYASQAGLASISTTSSGYFAGREICSDTQYIYATIPQWLGYIHNAKFVATTSFHGVVFCLIFHKNFIYFPLTGKYAKGNSRVISLLNSLGLNEKIFNKKILTIEQCIDSNIDWDKVDHLLYVRRHDSIVFLEENLQQLSFKIQ